MSFPGSVLSTLYDLATTDRAAQTKAGLTAFTTYLTGDENPLVRVLVDGASEAHQTSSVQILRKIAVGFAYAGTVEVAYRGDGALDALRLHLPELHGADEGKIAETTVKLVPYPIADGDTVNVGFTGGATAAEDTPDENFAEGLKVTTLLRLEPYGATDSPDQIQWSGDDAKPTIDLGAQRVLGPAGSFGRRAYSIPAPAEPDWDSYADGPYADQVAKLRWITEQVGDLGLDLSVTTGIRAGDDPGVGSPSEMIFTYVVGLQASQRDGTAPAAGARSVVVVNLDDLSGTAGASEVDWAGRLLRGGIGEADQAWLEQTGDVVCKQVVERRDDGPTSLGVMTAWQTRSQYVCRPDVQASTRARLRDQDATLATIEDDVSTWATATSDRVVFLAIGTVPAPVFAYVFSKATAPTVFADATTANLALTLGSPYFLVRPRAQQAEGGSPYPSVSLGASNYAQPAIDFQAAADRVNALVSSWTPLSNPASDIGAFVKRLRDDAKGRPLRDYLAVVAANYTPAERETWSVNDRFAMGVGFLNYAIAPRENPLPALHKEMCDNLKDGTLNLLPGIIASGPIFDFLAALGLPRFTIEGVTLDPPCADPPETIDTITVTGTTDSWEAAGPLKVTVELTAPEGQIVMATTFSIEGSWSPPGMPWVVFQDPYIRVQTYQAPLPTVGKVGGKIKDVGDFALTYPIEDAKWLFEGTYQNLTPDRVFALAGGMNLSSILPPPVNGFSTLQVASTELLYDSTPSVTSVEYVTVVITTVTPWPLLGTLTLQDLKAVVTVAQPTGKRALTADLGATFVIAGTASAELAAAETGSATIEVSAAYPGGKLSGKLKEGVITFDGLLGIFWPGVTPPLPELPTITALDVAIDTTTKDYSLSCGLNIGWEIPSSQNPMFTVDSLTFSLQSVKDATSGRLVGTVILGKAMIGNEDVKVELSAAYSPAPAGWTFSGRQVAGTLYLDTLVERFIGSGWDTGGDGTLGVKDIFVEVDTATGAYTVSGGTTKWEIPFLDGLTFQATLELHRSAATQEAAASLSGRLAAEIVYKFIDIQVYYAFAQEPAKSEFGFSWGVLHGTVAKNDEAQWVGTLKLDAFSIGQMVETMVSWATGQPYGLVAPWTFLNDISLKGLELTFNFTTNEVSLQIDIGLDVGFAKIDKFTLTYKPDDGGKVDVGLEGSFSWVVQGGAPPPPGTTVTKDAVAWDATKPENTPTPSGGGNSYLDLRLLVLGQHVSISGASQFESVEAVIKALREVKLPAQGCTVPIDETPPAHQLMYDSASSWLIATSFGVLKVEKPKESERLALGDGGDR